MLQNNLIKIVECNYPLLIFNPPPLCYLHEVHKMTTYRMDHLCWYVSIQELLDGLMKFGIDSTVLEATQILYF
jgi:hypothetical protein